MVKTRSTIKKEREISRLYKSGLHGDSTLTAPKKLDFDKAKTPPTDSMVTTSTTKPGSALKPSMTPRQKKLQCPQKQRAHKAMTPRKGSKVKTTSTPTHSAQKTPMVPRQKKLQSTPSSTHSGKTSTTKATVKCPLTPRFAVNKRYGVPSPPVFSPGKMISFDTPRKTHIDELHCVFQPGMSPFSPNRNVRNSGCREPKKMLSPTLNKKTIFVSPKGRLFASPLESGSVGTFSACSRGTPVCRGDSPLTMYVSFATGHDGHSTPSKLGHAEFDESADMSTMYSSPVITKSQFIRYWTPYPAIEDRPAPDMTQSHTGTALFQEDVDMTEFDAEFEDFALLDF